VKGDDVRNLVLSSKYGVLGKNVLSNDAGVMKNDILFPKKR
jgi:hypothetical protein